jgi:hypothetical protein
MDAGNTALGCMAGYYPRLCVGPRLTSQPTCLLGLSGRHEVGFLKCVVDN